MLNNNEVDLFFTKVRDVKSPSRGTTRSAGIDFFVPKYNQDFFEDLINKNPKCDIDCKGTITLFPGDRILIPSGIHVRIPTGYALFAHNKSGIASKKGLDKLAELVDEDYQGEIHISVVNTGTVHQIINEDDKLIQFVLKPVLISEIIEIETLEKLYLVQTERGTGGFGSTDKKT